MDLLLHIVIALGLGPSPSAVEGLRRTAPEPITTEVAAEHVLAARLVAATYGLDANLILSIDAHESRYSDAVTPESGHRFSCGPMTPSPIARCAGAGILVGVQSGADHLAGWIRAERGDLRRALLGYAGGYRLLQACAAGPVLRERLGGEIDLCRTPEVFLARAAWIRREMHRPET